MCSYVPLKWRPQIKSESVTVSDESPLSDFDSSVIAGFTCTPPKSFSNSASASVVLPI